MKNNLVSVCVGHHLATSERKSRIGYDDWHEKTYATFNVGVARPKKGITYIPITCTVCGKPMQIKVRSKPSKATVFTIRFILAFIGIAGIYVAFNSSIDEGFRIIGAGVGAIASLYSIFGNMDVGAVRLVSANPDDKHAILLK